MIDFPSFFFLRVAILSENDYIYERAKFTWMVLRLGIVNCKSKLFTQCSKDWNGSLWSLRREEVTNHSADWHFNSLLYSDVLLQLLLSLFCIWRMWGGFIVTPIPSAFKHCEVSWPYCLIWFYYYNLISMFHKNGLGFLFIFCPLIECFWNIF